MMRITYLGHSGFLVELEDSYLMFDYYKGELPKLSEEKRLYVFASHKHFDHFKKSIFNLREHGNRTKFILSDDIQRDPGEDVLFMKPNEEQTVGTLKVRTLRSTDEGVAFLVTCRERTIYHAGDLNWWHWEEEGQTYNTMMCRNYQYEVSKLLETTIDVAFLPVDPRQGQQYIWGLHYFMRNTKTSSVFPMHFWGDYSIFDRLLLETCTEHYRDKIVRIEKEGQQFLLK